jgi:hypothetical protein
MDDWISGRLQFLQILSEYAGQENSFNENPRMEVRNGGKLIKSEGRVTKKQE